MKPFFFKQCLFYLHHNMTNVPTLPKKCKSGQSNLNTLPSYSQNVFDYKCMQIVFIKIETTRLMKKFHIKYKLSFVQAVNINCT